jgi:putative hydrolase of the HAD superfamily
MNDIKHIFFDLDRTLWDFEKNSADTLTELFHELELAKSGIENPSDFIQIYVQKNDHCWELYRKNEISKKDLRSLRFRMAFEHFGVHDHLLAERVGDVYVDRSPMKTGLFPNTINTLEYLSKKYTLHIITNGFEEVQYIKMENSGIRPYFKHITTSERAGYKKPDVRIFHHAMSVGGASTYNSLMIGDDADVDVRGAANAGMKSILFQPDVNASKPEGLQIIHDLSELSLIL